MAQNAVKITKNIAQPEKAGDYNRLICLTGKNKGLCYYLKGARVVIGRGTTADIQILDTNASREHVELVKVGDRYVLTDLQSQNGVIVNDLKVTQHELKNNDKIIIGATVYKFSHIVVKENQLALVKDEDEEEEIIEEKKKTKNTKEDKPKKNKRVLIYGAAILLVVTFLLPSEETKTTKPMIKNQGSIDDISVSLVNKKEVEDKELEEKLESIIHRGQREYREGNYFRAMEEFRMALILSPEHGQASFYMQKSKQRLDENIKNAFIRASQDTEALKYSNAIVSYCSVIKLLQDYNVDDQRYVQAQNQIKDLEQKMGLAEGEIKCFETE